MIEHVEEKITSRSMLITLLGGTLRRIINAHQIIYSKVFGVLDPYYSVIGREDTVLAVLKRADADHVNVC